MTPLFLVSLALAQSGPQYVLSGPPGGTGVQLFQWTFRDIAKECVEFLGPNGYTWVQTSPVQAHVNDSKDAYAARQPWYLVYQPLGYSIGNRLGSLEDFSAMVATCRNASVEIVVDVVVNHMPYSGYSYQGGYGSHAAAVTTPFQEDIPDAGYTSEHFHDRECNAELTDYSRDYNIWNCRLAKLADLKTEHPYVRSTIAGFLNKLLDLGVAGFRVDAAKHIPPQDLQAILAMVRNTIDGNKKPYLSLEVYGKFPEPDASYRAYPQIGNLIGFDYGAQVGQAFRNLYGKTTDDLPGIMDGLRGSVPGTGITAILENHDLERS
ncbi:hypothetical protein HDU91_006252, partial [Kappamyces sp. JEL0680]